MRTQGDETGGQINGGSLAPGSQAFCDHSLPLLPRPSISAGALTRPGPRPLA